jgi:FkbM family methyltransferase
VRAFIKTVFRNAVPARVKEALVRAALRSMPTEALDRVSFQHEIPSMGMSFRQVRRLGFAPSAIIDVGAFRGEWTRFIQEIYPTASILMIEPQRESEPILGEMVRSSNGRIRYRCALLGPAARPDVPFFEMGNGSSVFPEQSPFPRVEVHHAMTTLDDVAREAAIPPAALLKLDVQGSEIEILCGGTTTLAQAEVVLLEVSLIGINRGAPLLDSVVAFMKSRGFVAYDICSLIRRNLDGALWAVDIIFVSERSALRSSERYQ